jgi:protein SCO1
MSTKALYGLLLTVLLPLAAYFMLKQSAEAIIHMPPHYFPDSVVTKVKNGKQYKDTIWHRLPDFSLTNQLGQTVSWKDLQGQKRSGNVEGKIVVANFFFTHCPTICPPMMLNMKSLQEGIKTQDKVGDREPDFVHFLSFSVDPERDSVAALRRWADRFQINPQNWWLLTGDKKTIYDLSINEMKLGLVDGENVDTSFVHSQKFVLIDKYRQIRGYYNGLDTADLKKLSTDIILLQLEKDPNRRSIFTGKLELLAIVFLLAVVGVLLLVTLLKRQNRKP